MSAFMTIDAVTLHGIIKQDNLVLIDVRNDDEVARGVIQGAQHIPLASLPQLFDKLSKKSSIVFIATAVFVQRMQLLILLNKIIKMSIT